MRTTVASPTTVNRACDWRRNLIKLRTLVPATLASATGRYCCKSLFALLIKNSPGCTRDFRVKMWGTSSPDGKLTGDLRNAIESTEIDGRRSRRSLAEKLSPGDFRLLQQYRPIAAIKVPFRATGIAIALVCQGETMKLIRRQFLRLAAGAAVLPATSRMAHAQAYPRRPVRIIVGFAAGGFTDITVRLMGQWLSERLGQPFVVENRTGAAGNIAVEAVVRAAPDGYTLLAALDANAANATLYDKLNFNFISDIAPVAGIARAPFVMAVNPAFPATTVPEFIAYAKANPGKVNMASAGVGSGPHLSG